MLINNFGNEVKIIDCRKLVDEDDQLREAKIRHLRNVRMRYLDYVIKMKTPSKSTVNHMLSMEKLYKQTKNERT